MNMIKIKGMFVAKEIRNVNGSEVGKEWLSNMRDASKLMFLAGHFCSFAGRVYKVLSQNEKAATTLGIVIDRLKEHIAKFVEEVTSDKVLVSAFDELTDLMTEDLDKFQSDADALSEMASKVMKEVDVK